VPNLFSSSVDHGIANKPYHINHFYLCCKIYVIIKLLLFWCYFTGAGSSMTMVTSLCITAELIGSHTENGAFIYSAVTFADKVLNGVAVVIIEDV
jgi:hypothetical protein